jgi:tRNA(fMet)-specific endonuclease VapC
MTKRYLLDTNIISALMQDPRGPCAARVRAVPDDALCTSEIVRGELHYGIERKREVSPEKAAILTSRFDRVFSRLVVCSIDSDASSWYGRVRALLEQAGTPIGANDLWIASHARALDCVMVTDNVSEFERVPNLVVENWLHA